MITLVIRNMLRNRKNSLVIFLLIAVITALFFTGNSLIGAANAALRTAYVDSLTADVILQKHGDMSMNLFGANSPVIDEYTAIPALPAYDHLMAIIASEPKVEARTSQVSGRAAMEIPETGGGTEGVFLCGVEPETYFDTFPGIELESGSFLAPGEYGAMITAGRADRILRETGTRPAVGTSLLFTSAGAVGFKIREVPLRGIYRYRNPGQFMNELVIADPQTVRVLLSVQVATAPAGDPAEALPVWNDDWDGETVEAGDDGFDPETLMDWLSGAPDAGEASAGGDWNFILLRLKKGISPGPFIRSLNKKLEPFNVHASGWRTAAGTSAIMMLLVQTFFNTGGFLVSAAGIIVVVNILLISVFRRTREIGTLRAIGASDGRIRFLVMGENCFLSFLAGAAGVLAGAAALALINSLRIEIPNDLVASLLGGKTLHIAFVPPAALAAFVIALVLGAAASIYPVETAVRIDPITAVNQG